LYIYVRLWALNKNMKIRSLGGVGGVT